MTQQSWLPFLTTRVSWTVALAVGLPLLAFDLATLVLAVRQPPQRWAAAGRDKRKWMIAAVAGFLLRLETVWALGYWVLVWPRLRRAACAEVTDARGGAPTGALAGVPSGAEVAGQGDAGASGCGGHPSGVGSGGVGELVVRRGHSGAGSVRRVRVSVDGVQVAALRPGEQAVVVVGAGRRSVVARLGSMRSAPLAVDVVPSRSGAGAGAGTGTGTGAAVKVAVTVPDVDLSLGVLVDGVAPLRVEVVQRFSRW